MNARHEQQTTVKAGRDPAAGPDDTHRHEPAIPVYRDATAWERSRIRHVEDDVPRPVDEPAPQPALASMRGRPRHGR
jgi:hypothetical protein